MCWFDVECFSNNLCNFLEKLRYFLFFTNNFLKPYCPHIKSITSVTVSPIMWNVPLCCPRNSIPILGTWEQSRTIPLVKKPLHITFLALLQKWILWASPIFFLKGDNGKAREKVEPWYPQNGWTFMLGCLHGWRACHQPTLCCEVVMVGHGGYMR